MKLAQDAHTRAEQQVYEYLWQNAKTLDEVSRAITIGFGAMARMVRLSESNARINVRSLIAKLATTGIQATTTAKNLSGARIEFLTTLRS